MADDDDRAGIIRDHLLQQVEGFEIEIVGRLVEHQQIRRQRQGAGQQQARALAARQARHGRARLLGSKEEVAHVADDVLLLAVDFDPVAAAARQRVLQGHVILERDALLVEARQFEIGAKAHEARVGFERAGQEVDERRLARAIAPDDAKPVAAQNANREIIDDDALAIGLRDVIRLDHELAGDLSLGDGNLDVAGDATRLAEFLAQAAQPLHASDISLAPPTDAVTHPMLLVGDAPFELVMVALLLLKHLVAPGLEFAEAFFEPAGATTIKPDRGAREILQKASIMADENDGRAHAGDLAFEPFDGGQIEMVGRLVEQQNIGLRRQRARERGAARLAARQMGGVFLAGQTQLFEQIAGAIGIVVGAEPILDIGEDGGEARQVRLLRQIPHGGVGLEEALALVEFEFASGDLQQGRLARAVAADQRQLVAGGDGNLRAFEQRLAADGQFDVAQDEKGRGHGVRSIGEAGPLACLRARREAKLCWFVGMWPSRRRRPVAASINRAWRSTLDPGRCPSALQRGMQPPGRGVGELRLHQPRFPWRGKVEIRADEHAPFR